MSATFNEIKLNPTIDSLSIRSRDTEEGSPFLIRAKDVSDDLIIFKLWSSIENLDLLAFIGNVHMIDWASGDDGQNVSIDPLPEDDVLWELNVLEFGFGVQVEDLENVTRRLVRGLQRNNVLADVHDGTINFVARSAHDVHLVGELDDADLGDTLSILISNSHVLFWLNVGDWEFEEAGVNPQGAEVDELSMFEWICLHFQNLIIYKAEINHVWI